MRDLWASDAVLSELILDRGGQTHLMESGNNNIVDRTGGATIVAGVPGEAFQESVHYLRSGYTMYYPLPDASPVQSAGCRWNSLPPPRSNSRTFACARG